MLTVEAEGEIQRKEAQLVTLVTCIREMPSLNLEWDTVYLNFTPPWLSSVLPW